MMLNTIKNIWNSMKDFVTDILDDRTDQQPNTCPNTVKFSLHVDKNIKLNLGLYSDGLYTSKNPPTVRNQMKCVLPRHSCISYLKDVKVYESALGAEYQEMRDEDFEKFKRFCDKFVTENYYEKDGKLIPKLNYFENIFSSRHS